MLDKEELTPLLSHTRHSLNNYSSQLQSTSQTMPVYHRTHHRTRHRTHHRTPAQQRTPARQFKLDTVSNTQKWATIKLSIISFVIIVWVLTHYLTERGHTTETTTSLAQVVLALAPLTRHPPSLALLMLRTLPTWTRPYSSAVSRWLFLAPKRLKYRVTASASNGSTQLLAPITIGRSSITLVARSAMRSSMIQISTGMLQRAIVQHGPTVHGISHLLIE